MPDQQARANSETTFLRRILAAGAMALSLMAAPSLAVEFDSEPKQMQCMAVLDVMLQRGLIADEDVRVVELVEAELRKQVGRFVDPGYFFFAMPHGQPRNYERLAIVYHGAVEAVKARPYEWLPSCMTLIGAEELERLIYVAGVSWSFDTPRKTELSKRSAKALACWRIVVDDRWFEPQQDDEEKFSAMLDLQRYLGETVFSGRRPSSEALKNLATEQKIVPMAAAFGETPRYGVDECVAYGQSLRAL